MTIIKLLDSIQELREEVDALKRSASKLKEAEHETVRQKIEILFEQSGTNFMILDPNTSDGIPVIVDANKSACEAHGYTRAEFIGRPVTDVDDEEGKRMCLERTQQMLNGEALAIENTHTRKDGTTFPVAVYANRVDVGDVLPLIITTEHDITERIQLEIKHKELLKSEAKLSEERAKRVIYTATARSAEHILNNLLDSMQLFKIKAEKADIFDDETKAQFEYTISEGTELVKKLCTVEVLTESNIKASVYPKSDK